MEEVEQGQGDQTPEQRVEEFLAYQDAWFPAKSYLHMDDVAPEDAALVLFGHDPRKQEEAIEAALESTIHGRDFNDLLLRFRDEAKGLHWPRRLLHWLQFALDENLHYGTWIERYAEAAGRSVADLAGSESLHQDAHMPPRKPLMQLNRERVLKALRDAGFDPGALPPLRKGKACPAKAAARVGAKLNKETFNHAWKELLGEAEVKRQH